jgi:hypothetical protein
MDPTIDVIVLYFSKKLDIALSDHINNISNHYKRKIIYKNVDIPKMYIPKEITGVPAMLCFNKMSGAGKVFYHPAEMVKILTPPDETPMLPFGTSTQNEEEDNVDSFIKPSNEVEIKDVPRNNRINDDDIEKYKALRDEAVPQNQIQRI